MDGQGQRPGGLGRTRGACAGFGVLVPVGLRPGEIWSGHLAALQQKREGKADHCEAALGSKGRTSVSTHAKFPSVRFDAAKSDFVPV